MKNNLTEHVLNIEKEFDENLVEMSPLRGQDMHNRPVLYDVEYDRIDEIKSHLLLSQLKTIELLKEELIEKKASANISFDASRPNAVAQGYNLGMEQSITLLDTIIQNIKSQIK